MDDPVPISFVKLCSVPVRPLSVAVSNLLLMNEFRDQYREIGLRMGCKTEYEEHGGPTLKQVNEAINTAINSGEPYWPPDTWGSIPAGLLPAENTIPGGSFIFTDDYRNVKNDATDLHQVAFKLETCYFEWQLWGIRIAVAVDKACTFARHGGRPHKDKNL